MVADDDEAAAAVAVDGWDSVSRKTDVVAAAVGANEGSTGSLPPKSCTQSLESSQAPLARRQESESCCPSSDSPWPRNVAHCLQC